MVNGAFDQVILCAVLERLEREFFVIKTGKNDDRRIRSDGSDRGNSLQPLGFFQKKIQQNDVDGLRLEDLRGVIHARSGVQEKLRVSPHLKVRAHETGIDNVVFDQEN